MKLSERYKDIHYMCVIEKIIRDDGSLFLDYIYNVHIEYNRTIHILYCDCFNLITKNDNDIKVEDSEQIIGLINL